MAVEEEGERKRAVTTRTGAGGTASSWHPIQLSSVPGGGRQVREKYFAKNVAKKAVAGLRLKTCFDRVNLAASDLHGNSLIISPFPSALFMLEQQSIVVLALFLSRAGRSSPVSSHGGRTSLCAPRPPSASSRRTSVCTAAEYLMRGGGGGAGGGPSGIGFGVGFGGLPAGLGGSGGGGGGGRINRKNSWLAASRKMSKKASLLQEVAMKTSGVRL